MIKSALLSFGILFFTLSLQSQVGLRAHYSTNHYEGWNDFFNTQLQEPRNIFSNSIDISIDYWIRLPNKRIELYPYLSYHHVEHQFQFMPGSLALRQLGLGIIAHFYILDLLGDCDCPTFSKQGSFIKKGFFLLSGVGADHSTKAVNDVYGDGNIDARFQVGMGLDIGVTDILTITPLIRYQYYPDISWHEMAQQFGIDINNVSTSAGQFGLGVRVGIRLDYR